MRNFYYNKTSIKTFFNTTANKKKRGRPFKIVPRDGLTEQTMKAWQVQGLAILREPISDITIFWTHGLGSSANKNDFIRFCELNLPSVLVVSCSGINLYNTLETYILKNKKGPNIIIIDIPRSLPSKLIDYGTLEGLKNGRFYSEKDRDMIRFSVPQVMVFSHERPLLYLLPFVFLTEEEKIPVL